MLTDFRAVGSFLRVMDEEGGFVTCLPSRALPRLGLPAGLAMAATPGGGEPWEGWPWLHLPRFAAIVPIPQKSPQSLLFQSAACHKAYIIFFFLMGKGVAASFHSNTYAHNTVCSCHHCWRGWLLLCLAGTVVVSFCPCSEGTPLVLQRWRRWARNKPGNILQVLPVSLLCVCL